MVHKHFSHRSKYQREENDLRWESALFSYTSNLNWELFCPNCQSQTPSLIPSTQKVALGNVDMLSTLLSSFFFPAPSKRGDGTPDQDCGRISHRTQLKSQSWRFGMDRTWYINIPKNNDWIELSISFVVTESKCISSGCRLAKISMWMWWTFCRWEALFLNFFTFATLLVAEKCT